MRCHLVALPHTQTVRDEFSECAYTQKVRKLATMLTGLGHEVILYAGDESDAEVAELVTCMSAGEQARLIPEWRDVVFDPGVTYWKLFNRRAVKHLRNRLGPCDVLMLTAGDAHAPIAAEFPEHLICEPGVGYGGVLPQSHRVFESYAWMHAVYGQQGAYQADGRFYDAVIPNFFEAEDFPAGEGDGGYALYLGRMVDRKGVRVAADACQRAGVRLVLAGTGPEVPDYGEHVGSVGPEERARLMGGATCLLAPTLYLEPFGGCVAEAMLCGTPAITTDFGAFSETVEHGVTGWRCRRLSEFQWAVEHAPELDRDQIRQRALGRFSTDAVAPMYDNYLTHLSTLWGEADGFNEPGAVRPDWGRAGALSPPRSLAA